MGIYQVLIDDLDSILKLIPQRPPMVMVDKLVQSDEKQTSTKLLIKESNIFCNDGVLTEPGLIENVAQTGAVRIGYIASQKNIKPPIGFIGAISNLNIYFLPAVNSELESTVFIEYEIYNALIIKAKIENEGKLAFECEMKIFLQNE